MITLNNIKMRIIIVFLLSVIMISCKNSPEKEIRFTDVSKVPIIEVKLNNKVCYLMVDTGASLSILDITQAKKYNFKGLESSHEVLGLNGKSNYYDLDNVNVELDTLQLVNTFKGGNLNHLVRVIEMNSGYKIAGIIGSDIFKTHEFKIDYSTNSIKYE